MRKFIHSFFLFLTFCLTFPLVPITSNADTYGYEMINGVDGVEYDIPPNALYTYQGITKDYGYFIESGVNIWNDEADDEGTYFRHVDVDFDKNTSSSSAGVEIKWAVYEYQSNAERFGFTYFYKPDGSVITSEPPNTDWQYARATLNVKTIHTTWSNSRLIALVQHEMGHAMGLAHPATKPDPKNCIMYPDPRYGTLRPTDYDITELNKIY